jgi:PKD repeat protein
MQKYLANPNDATAFQELASNHRIPAAGFHVEIEIFVPPPASTAAIDFTILPEMGFQKRIVSRNFMEGMIPIKNIFSLADSSPLIHSIRRVRRPEEEVISEGVSITNAQTWKNNGASGAGLKIAIIDIGFSGIGSAVGNGDFGSYTPLDFSGGGFPGTSPHGTACAEIAYDMAPSATYYLMIVASVTGTQNAKDYCKTNGIDIISMSLGWNNYDFCDGNGTICTIVDDAHANGILWVNAAGNEGDDHYWIGNWWDHNSDNWLDFALNDPYQNIYCTAGTWVSVILTWDNSTTSSEDYDLYLVDGSATVVGVSQNVQSGSQQPMESIAYYVPASNWYFIAIHRANANGTSKFRLYCDYQLEYGSTASSLSSPGDAAGSFTVGAINQSNWFSGIVIESYSSRGPTLDSRIKPDICGPTRVSTYTYGWQGFAGTSAATPHVAGIAALYLDQYPSSTPAQIRTQLESWAYDCGISGKDNTFGAGEVELYGTAPSADFSAAPLVVEIGNPISFSDLSQGLLKTWSWNFGDSQSSNTQNPSHTYLNVGAYTVSLTVSGPAGNDTETKTSYVQVSPKADFSALPLYGPGALQVQFTDTSVGTVDSWQWDFGDGETSDSPNPAHTFNSAGVFTVQLTVIGAGVENSETKTDYITVFPPTADFVATPLEGEEPLTVDFTPITTGTVNTYLWDFGDGHTADIENPSHNYSVPGTFDVSLTVYGPCGNANTTKLGYIEVRPRPRDDSSGCTCSPSAHPTSIASVFGCVLPYFFLAVCVCLLRRRSRTFERV